ncbi:MAG: hypothetical protein ACOYKN_18665 [Pirellula sp.]
MRDIFMRMVFMITVLALSSWCPKLEAQTVLGKVEATGKTRPLIVLAGADSKVGKPAYYRVSSEEAWQRIWLSHLGKTEADRFREHMPIVQIDFKKCMVIAIFKGAASNSRGLNIISTDEREDTVYLRFDDMSYQTAGGLDGGRVPVTPYAFVVIPNSAKLVLIEENIQSLKEKPPVWNERARLKAE